MHGPAVSAHPVAPVQEPGEEHVLSADNYRVPLGAQVPLFRLFAAH